jgi:hypothetical protein
LTDAEVVAQFMEPKPNALDPSISFTGARSPEGFWIWYVRPARWEFDWNPVFDETFGCLERERLAFLRLVEARLTPDEWSRYMAAVPPSSDLIRFSVIKALLHASAEQKLAALASVIRGNEK